MATKARVASPAWKLAADRSMPKLADQAWLDNKDRLILGALAALRSSGSLTLGIRDIERACDCSNGALFTYFRSKVEIVTAVAEVRTADLISEFLEAQALNDLRGWFRGRLSSLQSVEGQQLFCLDSQLASQREWPEAASLYATIRTWQIDSMHFAGASFELATLRVTTLEGTMHLGFDGEFPIETLFEMYAHFFAPSSTERVHSGSR